MPNQQYNRQICEGLPTQPRPGIGKVLVTGATGYIGGQLIPALIARGYDVRAVLRAYSPEYQEIWPEAEIVVADALNMDSLAKALEGVDTAFYLIHSLLRGKKEFEEADIQAAINFRKAAEAGKVRRIIYLGGLGDTRSDLSPHLRSRIRVAEELAKGATPTTILRASIIIGSGSASFEIMHYLVRNVPVFLIPRWARTESQPISVADVIKYLVGCLENDATAGKSFDIGGNDILSYEQMLKMMAELLCKKRIFIGFPFPTFNFFAYAASLFTPVPAPITICLMAAAKDRVVCHDNSIKALIPFETVPFKEAILTAMTMEERDHLSTRWSDAYPPAHELALKLRDLESPPDFEAAYSLASGKNASDIFKSICRIGGKDGWFNSNWMWWLRGMLDRILMGVGTARGRKSSSRLRVNDVIDFWRVEELLVNRKLLLRAEMKLPGRAWLQFTIEPADEGGNKLSVKALYQSFGVWGKLYWYIFLPFHHFIFKDLITQIEKRSAAVSK